MRQIDIFYRGMLRRSRRLQIFLKNNNSTTVTTTNIRSEVGYCPPHVESTEGKLDKRWKSIHVVNRPLR